MAGQLHTTFGAWFIPTSEVVICRRKVMQYSNHDNAWEGGRLLV